MSTPPPILLYHLSPFLCKSERFWRTVNFSYKPNLVWTYRRHMEMSIKGNRREEGWSGALGLPFHSSITELESYSFDERNCVPGTATHPSLLPQRGKPAQCEFHWSWFLAISTLPFCAQEPVERGPHSPAQSARSPVTLTFWLFCLLSLLPPPSLSWTLSHVVARSRIHWTRVKRLSQPCSRL